MNIFCHLRKRMNDDLIRQEKMMKNSSPADVEKMKIGKAVEEMIEEIGG